MNERLKYKRILLKLSGEVLQGEKGSGIDFKILADLCKQIAEIKKLGAEVVIVIGGGNFWRYRDFKDSGLDRVHSDYMGMLATVMNAMAIAESFNNAAIKSRALSAIAMPTVLETYFQGKALQNLKDGEIVICAGGTGSPYFTTDTTAALRALELNCEVVLKATKVDHVCDKDPAKHKDAKIFKKLTHDEVLSRGLQVMDLSAISLCMEAKLPIIVFNLKKSGNIMKVIRGEEVGTIIQNSSL